MFSRSQTMAKMAALACASLFTSTLPAAEFLKMSPSQAMRGTRVEVNGNDLPLESGVLKVHLVDRKIRRAIDPIDPLRTDLLVFIVPDDLPMGDYFVHFVLTPGDGKPQEIHPKPPLGRLTVLKDPKGPLKLETAAPVVAYPEGGVYELRMLGEGFSSHGPDNIIHVVGVGDLDITWTTNLADFRASRSRIEKQDEPTVLGLRTSSREIRLLGITRPQGSANLRVRMRIGNEQSEAVPVRLAKVGRWTPFIIAIICVAGLVLILFVTLQSGYGSQEINGRKISLLPTFFLDKQTNTYSLSKLQFYLWTGVGALGYVYLTMARYLIQGVFEFPPVPEGLPGIIAISTTTSVTAIGVSASKGSKGAGDQMPSAADFFTVGGSVVAERFQFFVWTIIGVGAYVFLMVASDPATIDELPKVPEGFLYLMGISSAGYLGGKLARKPGPIVSEVSARQGSLILTIRGQNLSKSATFLYDDAKIGAEMLDQGAHKDLVARVKLEEDHPRNTEFAKILELTIANPNEDWNKEGKHSLTVINADQQKAVHEFSVPFEAAASWAEGEKEGEIRWSASAADSIVKYSIRKSEGATYDPSTEKPLEDVSADVTRFSIPASALEPGATALFRVYPLTSGGTAPAPTKAVSLTRPKE